MIAAVCVAIATAGISSQASAAPTPSGYRTTLNGICRSYTPTFKRLQAAMKDAAAAKDAKALGMHLGRLMVLQLEQDRRVGRVPVPPALATTMRPIFGLLGKADRHLITAIDHATRGNGNGMVVELTAVSKLLPGINRRFDAAGLGECGSKQA